jgi:hypothetical protein
MGIALLKTDNVNRCAQHILDPSHYNPDGSCQCVPAKQLTLRQKEQQALEHSCPVCQVNPGFRCIHQQSTRKIRLLKFPHPERIRLAAPDYTYKLPAFRQAGNSGKEQGKAFWNARNRATGVNKASVKARQEQSQKRESYH